MQSHSRLQPENCATLPPTETESDVPTASLSFAPARSIFHLVFFNEHGSINMDSSDNKLFSKFN